MAGSRSELSLRYVRQLPAHPKQPASAVVRTVRPDRRFRFPHGLPTVRPRQRTGSELGAYIHICVCVHIYAISDYPASTTSQASTRQTVQGTPESSRARPPLHAPEEQLVQNLPMQKAFLPGSPAHLRRLRERPLCQAGVVPVNRTRKQDAISALRGAHGAEQVLCRHSVLVFAVAPAVRTGGRGPLGVLPPQAGPGGCLYTAPHTS